MKARIGNRSVEIGVKPEGRSVNEQAPVPYGALAAASPSYRSKLEARYAQHLKALEFSGSIAFWHYEPMNFRLPGEKNFYKPDFLIVAGDGITFVDTKGRNKSDERSLVKIKTAAGLHRWAKFMQVRWEKGMWVERTIEAR